MRNRFRHLLVRASPRASDERGFAVPTVLLMLMAAFAIVSVGVFATIQAQHGAVRDQSTKSAFTAAETGVSQAVFRYNAYATAVPPAATPCVMPSGSALALAPTQTAGAGAGWCNTVSGSSGSGSYGYQVCPGSQASPCNTTVDSLRIVSTGTVNGVTRREAVTVNKSSNAQFFSDAGVKTQNSIVLDSNAEVHTGSATGGDITLNGNAKQCGTASVGVGHHLTINNNGTYWHDYDPATGTCSGAQDASTVAQENLTLPPVNQGDAATNNDNFRLTNALSTATPPPTPADLISGKKDDVAWNATTRRLTVDHNTQLHLTGKTYSFCTLTLQQNSALLIPAGNSVNIYFDSPETCGLAANTNQLAMDQNTRITSDTGAAATVAMFFVGSQSIATRAQMSSNTQAGTCVQNFVIYAPYTDIEMNSNSTYCGAMAGKSLHMNSNAKINIDSTSQSFELPGTLPHYVRSRFVECTATATSSTPDSGC